tara:strand:+ start:44 stop:274 length:231 start_codon:yes stop_codon:yes gene_type:complete
MALNDFEGRLLPLSLTFGLMFPEKFLTLLPEGRGRVFALEEDGSRVDWGRVIWGLVVWGRTIRWGLVELDELFLLL